MKKIFYILASAIVALGAVACDNQDLDNIAPAGEGLTITATIDNTKVVFDGMAATEWSEGDFVTIGDYTFNYVPADGVFRCSDANSKNLVGETLPATANALNSAKGIYGATFNADAKKIENGVKFVFNLSSALVKYTTTAAGVTFGGTALSNDEVADADVVAYNGTKYIAIKAGENLTLSCSVDGVKCKEVTGKTFEAGKIYDLGELNPNLLHLKPSSDWKSASATFKAYFFGTAGSVWVDAVDGNKDGTYTALVPNGDYANIIFCRMNPSGADVDMWKNVWNQTQDMVVSIGDTCGIAGWNSGVWKTEWNKDNVYLNSMINGDWKTANHFAAWTWPDGGSGSWVKMEKTAKSGLYVVAKSKLKANVLFTAQKNATSSWSVNKQTGDLKTATTDANIYDVNNSAWVTATF